MEIDTKGMYRTRIQKAWGHTAHRGWARLLLDRARDLIIRGSAHRSANGVAMPTDEAESAHAGLCTRMNKHTHRHCATCLKTAKGRTEE